MTYGTTIHSIGGTPISTYARESGFEFGIGDMAGEGAISEPYREGFKSGTVTLKGRDYPLFLTILGLETDGTYTRERYITNVRALAALIYNADGNGDSQPFTLTRVDPTSTGPITQTITARYRDGFRVQQASWSAGRVAPVLTLLDPRWTITAGGAGTSLV